jgi:hypothetical protein
MTCRLISECACRVVACRNIPNIKYEKVVCNQHHTEHE